jgi:hypothetical protein
MRASYLTVQGLEEIDAAKEKHAGKHHRHDP